MKLEEPSLKFYQYLHDYACKMVEFLEKNKIKYRLKYILLDFILETGSKRNIRMNYPINFININEQINCFLYECSKYKFPRELKKIIHQLQQYHLHHQKM